MEMQMQEAALVKEKREKPVRPAAVHETPFTKRYLIYDIMLCKFHCSLQQPGKKFPHQASRKEKGKGKSLQA